MTKLNIVSLNFTGCPVLFIDDGTVRYDFTG
jgi:hypothetical protein